MPWTYAAATGSAPPPDPVPGPGPGPDPVPSDPRRAGRVLAWGTALALFALYAALAVRDQQRMLTSGFDLGIFDETVRSYAHGQLPIVALKGPRFDELGDHFSPAWALLAPFYRLFPTVYTLLLAQAALFALGAVPLVRRAADQAGRAAAAVVGVCYGLSWGIASAAAFDVHEVAFAVPLLAYSATALGQGRWRAAAAWGLPLLLVKEDLGVTLAAIGVYIALHGARRLGLATVAAGLLGTYLEIKVLLPAFDSGGPYTYIGSLNGAFHGAFHGALFGLPHALLTFDTPQIKLDTTLIMLAITGFLAVRSPVTLLVVPTLAWRFLSDDQTYWGTSDQYSAVLMPIVFAGFVDALVRSRAGGHPYAAASARTALLTSLVVTAALLPGSPYWALTKASAWHTDPRIAVARQVIAQIPGGATVAASNQLVPQLTDRDTVSLLDIQTPVRRPAWVIADTDDPDSFPMAHGQEANIISTLMQDGYHTVADLSGYLLLED